jgi:hypothetical protein
MKFHTILVLVFAIILGISNAFAQPPGAGAPPGAGDKTLGDNDIKLRSVELERIKREAQVAEAASYAPINPKLVAQFSQIKDDYEAIQILQGAIIKAYTTGKTIDYSMIETSAALINKRALRLDSNLFASSKTDKIETKSDEKKEKVLSVRDLIINLDSALGNFVSSPIFGKLKVIEPDIAIKTRDDLFRVLNFSEKLATEAKKMK